MSARACLTRSCQWWYGLGVGVSSPLSLLSLHMFDVKWLCAILCLIGPADAATVGGLAAALACLCHEAAAVGAAALLQQLLAALSHLASYWPHLVAPCAASLAMLLVQQQSLGSTDMLAVLALLARLLQHLADSKAASSSPHPGLLAPLLLLPLLQHVAFGGSKDVKQWAGHTLGLLRQLGDTDGSSRTPAATGLHGETAAAQAAQQLLAQLCQRPLEARHWLASLNSTLAVSAAATVAGSGSGGGGRAAREQQQVDSGAFLMLSALLQHPEEAAASAALQAAATAVEASPLLALILLPVLLHQLQGQGKLFLSDEGAASDGLLAGAATSASADSNHQCKLVYTPLFSGLTPGVKPAALHIAIGDICRQRSAPAHPNHCPLCFLLCLQASGCTPPACCCSCYGRCRQWGVAPPRCLLCCARFSSC